MIRLPLLLPCATLFLIGASAGVLSRGTASGAVQPNVTPAGQNAIEGLDVSSEAGKGYRQGEAQGAYGESARQALA